MEIKIVPAYDFPEEVGILFSEYTKLLIAGDSTFQEYLDIQHYDEEIKHLDVKYGPPGGRLYLAYCDGQSFLGDGVSDLRDDSYKVKHMEACCSGKVAESVELVKSVESVGLTETVESDGPAGLTELAGLSELAGCIGLRKIDEKTCELKRLYVRPQFRGHGIGEQLIEKIIGEAKEAGYERMLLDTLPFLKSAIYLYRKYGFYEIESYNDSPMSSSIFMRLDL